MSIHQPGPPLRSAVKGSRQLIPAEFLAKTGFETINQQSPLDVDLNEPGWIDLLIESQIEQTRTNERRKSNTYLLGDIRKELDDETFIARTGQIGHHVRKLVREGSHLVVDALTESGDQHNLGNGWMDQNQVQVDEVFPERRETKSRPDVMPQDFAALLTTDVVEITNDDPYTPPAGLTAGQYERTNTELTEFHTRHMLRSRDLLSLPRLNRNFRTNRFKQTETVDRWLRDDSTTPFPPTEVRDVEWTKLGDGTALEVRSYTDELFDQHTYERVKPDVTPEDFRALLTTFEESFLETDQAEDPFPLAAGVLLERQQQEDVFNRRVTRRSRDLLDLPQFIFNLKTNRFKQQVTIMRKLDDEAVMPPVPTSTADSSYTVLGDGTALTEVESVANVFENLTSAVEVPDLVPEIFRAMLPTFSREFTVQDALVSDPPILALGDFQRQEEQIDLFDIRVRTRGRAGITYPQAVTILRHTGAEKFGGEVTKLEGLLDDSEPVVETGLDVVDSEVRNLGNGTWFRQTERLDIALAWPTLIDRLFDPEIQDYVEQETQVVDPSYIPISTSGSVENLKAIDKWHSRRIKVTKDFSAHSSPETALISYRYHPFQFPGTLDYNRLITYDHREGYRKASALLAKHTIRTWWIDSATTPTVGNADLGTFDVDVKEIISDTVNVPIYTEGNTTLAQTFPEVLHDDITNTLGAFYPATTPSFTEYYVGIGSGSGGTVDIAVILSGGTGYTAGNTLSAGGVSISVIAVGATGNIIGYTQSGSTIGVIVTGYTDTGPASATGGSGSGATFEIFSVAYESVVPGSAWVGNERPVAADIKPTEVPNIWKVITESVVMR